MKQHRKVEVIALFGLLFLALAGNYFSLTLFFGIEVIFGSIFSLLAIALLGPVRGLLITTVTAAYTISAWNHPYAAIVLVSEGVFVAATFKRFFRTNLALASGTFWVLIGIPLAWFLYRFGLGMANDGALLIGVKQGANGIINAVAAALIITYSPLKRWSRNDLAREISVFEHTFNIFVGLALVPAVVVVLIDARSTVNRVERDIRASLEIISTGISLSIGRWESEHVKVIEQLAMRAEDFNYEDKTGLQKLLKEARTVWPQFISIFFTDVNGTTVAFDPALNKRGQSTVGLNFSDRPYFQDSKAGTQQLISKVFMARGGVFQPVVNIVSRVDIKNRFAGIVSGSLNLKDIATMFSDVATRRPFTATLMEADGTIISSNNNALEPLENYSTEVKGARLQTEGAFFRRWPENTKQAPMELWKNSAFGKHVAIPNTPGWYLTVEVPVAPWQSELYRRYIQVLSFLIILSIIILFASLWIATTIAGPLQRLSLETTNLPERLESQEEVEWPVNKLTEIKRLSENFRVMVEALKKRFSDLEKSRRELDRVNKVKDEFLATLSHELRTPLNAILGHSELLRAESSSSEQTESVEAIHRNAKAQNQIIADLLDVSAIVTGKINFNFEVVSLNQTIQVASEGVKRSAEIKQQKLKLDLSSRDVLLRADPTRLQQVLWNLLVNAVKFTPEGGEISLQSVVTDQGCTVRISDSGQGIEPAFLPSIFDRFRQEDSSRTRKHGGLGLGLAIVQQIVQSHDGTVSAESAGRDRGSTFTVFLPASRFVTSMEATPSNPTAIVDNSQLMTTGLKVLIVDDDHDARALAERFLQGTGALVDTASSAAQGIEKFLTFQPDVVVSDIGMPGEDGFAFISKLRRAEGGANIPAAAVTAFAAEADREAVLAAGFNAHVTKPVSKSELVRVVSELSRQVRRA